MLISSTSLPGDLFAAEPLLTSCILSSEGKQTRRIDVLLDTGATGVGFVDYDTARALCTYLHFSFVQLVKPKPLRGFDGTMARAITHAIYPNMLIQDHFELTAPLMVTKLGQHPIILGKPWMHKHGVLLDMFYEKLIFRPTLCKHTHSEPLLPHAKPIFIKDHSPETSTEPDTRSRSASSIPTKILQRIHDAVTDEAKSVMPDNSVLPVSQPTPTPANENESKSLMTESSTEKPVLSGKEDTYPPIAYPKTPKNPQQRRRNRSSLLTRRQGAHPITVSAIGVEDAEMSTIGAAPFHSIAKKKGSKVGTMSIKELDILLQSKPEELIDSREMDTAEKDYVLNKLPEEYHDFLDVFDKTAAKELPPHRPYDHKIQLEPDSQPTNAPLYPMSHEKLRKVKEYLDENLSKGYIKASSEPFAAPILFVQKKDGSLRFCVDYRKLNAITKRDRYPLPLIQETLAQMLGAKYFTKLDIIAAFNKIRMDPDSEKYTSFKTRFGTYQYQVLPFGLTNGPATYQHYMNDVLFEYLDDFCTAYLDDILVYSKTLKEHKKHVRLVLQRLREAGLQVDIEKCEFHVQETTFLGLIISTEGIKMDPAKVEAVKEWPAPTTVKHVQAFLGFCNFYRRFIKNFGGIAQPLTKLTKKDNTFEWTAECQKAFEELKARMISAPVLKHFDRLKTVYMETDASDYVIGGVMSQKDDEGQLHPVAFYSKKMLPAEQNYAIYDKELLAIIRGFEEWRPELEGTDEPVQVFTDHKGLEYFMTKKSLTRRQKRWADFLEEFNFRIMYHTGRQNAKADALTRRSDSIPTEEDKEQVLLGPDRVQIYNMDRDEERTLPEWILQANKEAPSLEPYRNAIRQGVKRLNKLDLEPVTCEDGVLYRREKLWVPEEENLRTLILREVHDQRATGHLGQRKTIHLLQRYYFWPGLISDTKRYIQSCHTCHRAKPSRQRPAGKLEPLPVPEQRWQDVAIDFVVGLPKSNGKNAIFTVTDRLSKGRHFISCTAGEKGTSAEKTADMILRHVWKHHGLFSSVVSDRGPQFIADVWQSLCRRLGIKAKLSTAYHPQTDGQSENSNQWMKQYLRLFVNYHQTNWDDLLPMAEFAANAAPSDAIGMSPFFLNHGYEPRMSFTPDKETPASTRQRLEFQRAEDISARMQKALETARTAMKEAQETMTAQANKTRRDETFNVGDRVYVDAEHIKTTRPSKGLDHKRLGPFTVIGRKGSSCQLELPEAMKLSRVFHRDRLTLAKDDPLPGQVNPEPDPIIIDGEDEWQVDEILDSKLINGVLSYRAKWLDYDEVLQYYPHTNFKNCQDLVDEYHKEHPDRPGPDTVRATRTGRRRNGEPSLTPAITAPPSLNGLPLTQAKRGRGRPRKTMA